VKARAKLEALRDMMALRDFVDEGPVGKRRLPVLSKADLEGIDGEVEGSANENAANEDGEEWAAEESAEFDLDRPVDLTLFDV
jgi:hypothetical protein